MPQTIEAAPTRLAEAVGKKYQRTAFLEKSEIIDYRNELRPLWNGTVHIFKLSGKVWPERVFAFRMGSHWKCMEEGPINYQTPLDAVKAAWRDSASQN